MIHFGHQYWTHHTFPVLPDYRSLLKHFFHCRQSAPGKHQHQEINICEMKPMSLDFGSWWKIKACRYSYTPSLLNCMFLYTFTYILLWVCQIPWTFNPKPVLLYDMFEIPAVRAWVLRKTQPWPSPSTKLADATAISFISLPFLWPGPPMKFHILAHLCTHIL